MSAKKYAVIIDQKHADCVEIYGIYDTFEIADTVAKKLDEYYHKLNFTYDKACNALYWYHVYVKSTTVQGKKINFPQRYYYVVSGTRKDSSVCDLYDCSNAIMDWDGSADMVESTNAKWGIFINVNRPKINNQVSFVTRISYNPNKDTSATIKGRVNERRTKFEKQLKDVLGMDFKKAAKMTAEELDKKIPESNKLHYIENKYFIYV